MTRRNAPLIIASAIAGVSIGASLIAVLTTGTASASGAFAPDDVSPSPSISVSVTPPAPTVTVTKTVTARPTPTNTKPTLHIPTTIHVRTTNVDVLRTHGKQIITSQLLRSGHDAGRGIATCVPASSAAFSCKNAYALAGGVLIFRDTVNVGNGTLKGTVTGGSGAFAGARGSITGKSRGGRGVSVTIDYYT